METDSPIHAADPEGWKRPNVISMGQYGPTVGVPRILGVESTFWSDFTTKDAELWPMLMPRLLGVATKAWQGDGGIPGAV